MKLLYVFLKKNACMMDHEYNGDIIIDGIAEVLSENLETPDNDECPISVETEKKTLNMNIPTQAMSQSRSNSARGISGKTNAPNSKNILGPILTRAKRTTYIRRSGLEYLKEKHEKEMELEAKRLMLEERKVAVSERTIALAEKKFSVESENFRNIHQSQQHSIGNSLNIVKDLKSNTTQS